MEMDVWMTQGMAPRSGDRGTVPGVLHGGELRPSGPVRRRPEKHRRQPQRVASPAVDLPWLAGPKSRQPRSGEPRRGPAVDCRASARKEEESEAEKKFVAAAIKDKAAGPGRNLVMAADDADGPKKGQFFIRKINTRG